MNANIDNSKTLSNICSDLFSLALYLREFRYNRDLDELFDHTVGLFDEMKKESENLGIKDEDIEDTKYALVAFIDEILRWGMRLQLYYYEEGLAGEKFYDKLELIMHSEDNREDVLEVYYICLALGFKGKFISNPEKIKEYLDDIKGILSILFSVSADFKADLDSGIISFELRGKFKEYNLPLSDNVSVSREGKDRWLIVNENRIYIAEKEEKLSVYKINEFQVQDDSSNENQEFDNNQDKTLVFLFNTVSNLKTNLNSGNIPKVIQGKFQDKGIQISDNVKVSVQRDINWLITDGIDKYSVKKEETINFYEMLEISPNGIFAKGFVPNKPPTSFRKYLIYPVTALIIFVFAFILVIFKININALASDVIQNIILH